jgi:NAD-dependent DNA ligase
MNNTTHCIICNKKLSFWNQPVFGKGTLQNGDKTCSSCFLKINKKSPQIASNLKNSKLNDILNLLQIEHRKPISEKTTSEINERLLNNLSPKLHQILKSKTNLTENEISLLSEAEGWNIVYSLNKPKEKLQEVCFTGFTPNDREILEKLAEKYDFSVVKSITKHLSILCVGENAGPTKIEKAKMQNTNILTEKEFKSLVKTGEIPT